jgi:hypothetical protein
MVEEQRTWFRAALPTSALLCAVGALVACQPHAQVAGTAPQVTASATVSPPTPAPAVADPAPSGGTGAGSDAAGRAGCRKAGLNTTVGRTDAGSGHRLVVLLFTNTGSQPCRTTGYPTVTAINGDGGAIAQAKHTRAGYLAGVSRDKEIPAIILAPGQTASAAVEALAFDPDSGDACTPYAALLVAAPGDGATTRLPWPNDGCSTPEVHPIVPGTDGSLG